MRIVTLNSVSKTALLMKLVSQVGDMYCYEKPKECFFTNLDPVKYLQVFSLPYLKQGM